MSKELIKSELKNSAKILDEFINNNNNIENINNAADIICDSINSGGKVISCGNGGSMSDSMHFAEEMVGNFRKKRKALPAIAISDPSYITCISNDFGFENIFSRFIEAFGSKNDILLAISTSGNSENILNAAKSAKKKGIKIISLTGKTGGKLAEISDIDIRAPYTDYSDRTQEIHIKVIHILIHLIETKLNLV